MIFIFPYAGYSTKAQSADRTEQLGSAGHMMSITMPDQLAGHSAMRLADSLFEKSEYRIASIEYERVFFLTSDFAVKTEALLRKAACLKQMQQFRKAEQSLNRANFAGLNDTLIYKLRFQSALCAYLGGNFNNAESQLIQIHYFLKDTILTMPSLLLYVLVLNELNRWDEAKEKIVKWISLTDPPPAVKDSLLNIISKIYHADDYPKFKKLKNAQRLSSFLPGAGQLYAGYLGEGLANVSLQLAALAFTGYAFYFNYYITAFIVGYGIFSKFYIGGINRLEYLVNKKNYELLRGFNDRLKGEILKIMENG